MAMDGAGAEKYLKYAEELRVIATDMKNGKNRDIILKIAAGYELMADALRKTEAARTLSWEE